MNKLIKFMSLTIVFGSCISLYPATPAPQPVGWSPCGQFVAVNNEIIPAEDLYINEQTHLLTKCLLGEPFVLGNNEITRKDNRIFIYSANAILEFNKNDALRQLPFSSLQELGFVEKILVGPKAYKLMETFLPIHLTTCEDILSKLNLSDLAQKYIAVYGNNAKLKQLATQTLALCNVNPPSYGTAFIFTLCMHSGEGSYLPTALEFLLELKGLDEEVWKIVQDVVILYLQSCTKQEEISKELIQDKIGDSFIVACNIVALRYFLTEIKTILDQTPNE